MSNTRTLALAAVAALSLGVGTAMAQSDGAGFGPEPSPQFNQQLKFAPVARPVTAPVQAGSSDVDVNRPATTVNPALNIMNVGGDGSSG